MAFDYTRYQLVHTGEKTLLHPDFLLSQKKSNAGWLICENDTFHEEAFIVQCYLEKHKARAGKFKIGVRYEEMMVQPYFRFDSDGPAHRNKCRQSANVEQVTTPHFNFYDAHGCDLAMKTEPLKDTEFIKNFFTDLSPAMKHFCDIAHIVTDGRVIRIADAEGMTLPLDGGEDFLESITFE